MQNHSDYTTRFEEVSNLFHANPSFRQKVLDTTRSVLTNTGKEFSDIDAAAELGCFYLLSELAFLEFASGFLGCSRVVYVYHRLWPVYEDYLAGKFDTSQKPHLGFQLLEAPHEYFESTLFDDALERVTKTGQLLAGFIDYRYAFYRSDSEYV